MLNFDLVLDDEVELDYTDSKFFGEIAIPEKTLMGNEFSPDEAFICQINLENDKLYYKNFILKNQGVLTFFVDIKKRKAIVRYFAESLDAYTSFNDDLDYDIDFVTELKIEFCEKNDYTVGSMLFTDENCDGKVCLLKINNFSDEPLLPFKCSSAYFLIDEVDLLKMDFSKIDLKLIK